MCCVVGEESNNDAFAISSSAADPPSERREYVTGFPNRAIYLFSAIGVFLPLLLLDDSIPLQSHFCTSSSYMKCACVQKDPRPICGEVSLYIYIFVFRDIFSRTCGGLCIVNDVYIYMLYIVIFGPPLRANPCLIVTTLRVR